MDEIAQASLLYDFYGQLLTKRQREVMALYHEENLSLSEIAGEFSISRQGVYDALKNAEKTLKGYEEKLGLVKKFQQSRDAISRIDRIMDGVLRDLDKENSSAARRTAEELKEVKEIIDKLED
ncbi:MAG: YlxM family DNA-binding protein [Bacillota bacterium]|nr:YlxM family DNA-binding protein [Bacillota bacterium]